jgi:hypothetical protein
LLGLLLPKKKQKLLRGGLNWVVLTGLKEQRDGRFKTSSALAPDIQVHLADEAVQYRPPAQVY